MRSTPLLALLLFTGCFWSHSYRSELDQWIDRPADELVAEWGPPTKQLRPAKDTTVLEYSKTREEQVPAYVTMIPFELGGQTTSIPYAVDPAVRTWHCTTQFTLDSAGMIVDWAYEGDDCVPTAKPEESGAAEDEGE